MPGLSPNLAETNALLEQFLSKLSTLKDCGTVQVEPEELSFLLARIPEVATWISCKPDVAAQEEEVRRYRANLAQLYTELPYLEVRLRMERARLDLEREQLQNAAGWAAGRKQLYHHLR